LDTKIIIYLNKLLINQIKLGTGMVEYGGNPYLLNIIYGLFMFPVNMINYPIGFLIGDGFSSSFGIIGEGGDFGLLETLYSFGLPLFMIIIFGLISLIIKTHILAIKHENMNYYAAKHLKFAVCTISFIMFHELHMSIWGAKSILPLLFFSVAIINRYIITVKQKPLHNYHYSKN